MKVPKGSKDKEENYSYILLKKFEEERNVLVEKICESLKVLSLNAFPGEKNLKHFDYGITNSDGDKGNIISFSSDDFTLQYQFWKQNKSFLDWVELRDEKFHLNSSVIFASYIAYTCNVEKIIIDSSLFQDVDKKFSERILYQFFSVFTEETDISVVVVGENKFIDLPSIVKGLYSYKEVLEVLDISTYNPLNFFDRMNKEITNYKLFDNDKIPYNFSGKSSCAIIGNSRNILDLNYGELIDNHDIVVRINNAPVEKYEDKVGTRTDFRFVNKVLVKGEYLNDVDERNWIKNVTDENLIFNLNRNSLKIQVTKKTVNKNNLYFVSENFSQEMENFKDMYGLSENLLLSSGMQCILIFNLICEKISLFGFDFYSDEHSHYWEQISDEFPRNITHDWEGEKEIVENFCSKSNFIIHD